MECPICSQNIGAATGRENTEHILRNLYNEEGLQERPDILPLLAEESYLRAYPRKREARAFLEFCRKGDTQAVLDLLDDEHDDDEERDAKDIIDSQRTRTTDVLQYQDPLASMYSGSHIAVINEKIEVI